MWATNTKPNVWVSCCYTVIQKSASFIRWRAEVSCDLPMSILWQNQAWSLGYPHIQSKFFLFLRDAESQEGDNVHNTGATPAAGQLGDTTLPHRLQRDQ